MDTTEIGSWISGNDSANTLSGSVGRDSFHSGAGSDYVEGGGGADRFVFDTSLNPSSNVDILIDFTPGDDSLVLRDVLFSSIERGALSAANFVATPNPIAHDSDDFILYNTSTGNLYYDADASGAQPALLFAILLNHPVLAAQDVRV